MNEIVRFWKKLLLFSVHFVTIKVDFQGEVRNWEENENKGEQSNGREYQF